MYATDGTTAGTRMVKDIHPGLGGSDPTNFYAAGNGVVYFTANDGGGPALWRSDGTAAGTFKAAPLAGDMADGGGETVGWHGDLFYVTRNQATGRVAWWKTDGTTNTLLKDFGTMLGLGPPYSPDVRTTDAGVVLPWLTSTGQTIVLQTDGTPAGTRLQQQVLTVGGASLAPGVEIGPGRLVFASYPTNGSTASVWVGDGITGPQLVKAFDATPNNVYVDGLFAADGKAFFRVRSNSGPQTADAGLWVTDGTAAGTTKITLPATVVNLYSAYGYGDTVLLTTFAGPILPTYYLTDGTAAGTRQPCRRPGAGHRVGLRRGRGLGRRLAGFLLFQNVQTGQVFLRDAQWPARPGWTRPACRPARRTRCRLPTTSAARSW